MVNVQLRCYEGGNVFKYNYTVCGPWSASLSKTIKYFVKKKNTLKNERYRDLLMSILSYHEVQPSCSG